MGPEITEIPNFGPTDASLSPAMGIVSYLWAHFWALVNYIIFLYVKLLIEFSRKHLILHAIHKKKKYVSQMAILMSKSF